MYQNLINNNHLVSQFNGYQHQNPNMIPFQNNQLINQNVHVMNNLNNLLQQQKSLEQNMPVYQQQLQSNTSNMSNRISNKNKNGNARNRSTNIIEEMLKPQKIAKDNKDVATNYKASQTTRKDTIDITNQPYKIIIKDKIDTILKKQWDKVVKKDLIVHTVTDADSNIDEFNKKVNKKQKKLEKINDEIEIDFHIDNFDSHKKKFEYKQTFIRNLAFESNTFDESKEDYIDFYKKHQKEAEEGKELCDNIIHNMIDTGLIKPEELPTETLDDLTQEKLDLSLDQSKPTITNNDPGKHVSDMRINEPSKNTSNVQTKNNPSISSIRTNKITDTMSKKRTNKIIPTTSNSEISADKTISTIRPTGKLTAQSDQFRRAVLSNGVNKTVTMSNTGSNKITHSVSNIGSNKTTHTVSNAGSNKTTAFISNTGANRTTINRSTSIMSTRTNKKNYSNIVEI